MTIDLDDPIALMLAAAAALERSGAACAAYGGLALAMYGEPRDCEVGVPVRFGAEITERKTRSLDVNPRASRSLCVRLRDSIERRSERRSNN